ncbi:MAG: DUF3108 domain-containing protein [Bacteroidota bacterium]
MRPLFLSICSLIILCVQTAGSSVILTDVQTITGDSDDCQRTMICPGEELIYEVSWFGVGLGQIRLQTREPTWNDGERRHHATAVIDSYKGLPFVSVHARDYTEMDSNFSSRRCRSFEKNDGYWLGENYYYLIPEKILVVEKTKHETLSSPPAERATYDTLRITDSWFEDGLSLVYFARANVHRRDTLRAPTIVYGKVGATNFYFTAQNTTEEIGALKNPVRVIEFAGKAEFAGIFGLTGDFKGWFSDDEAAAPIKAEMKVLIGNITIELIQWKRHNWNPPTVLER